MHSRSIMEKRIKDIKRKTRRRFNTFVDWKNAGFNPEVSSIEEDLSDITKHSMGFEIRYQY